MWPFFNNMWGLPTRTPSEVQWPWRWGLGTSITSNLSYRIIPESLSYNPPIRLCDMIVLCPLEIYKNHMYIHVTHTYIYIYIILYDMYKQHVIHIHKTQPHVQIFPITKGYNPRCLPPLAQIDVERHHPTLGKLVHISWWWLVLFNLSYHRLESSFVIQFAPIPFLQCSTHS